ncbi:MAG: hypothetical protein HC906_09035 [Bacteroidales bacterium]|nr:hypothetical protein [Bacteroidales bacterium]
MKKLLTDKGIPKVPMFAGNLKLPIGLLRHHFGVINQYKNPTKFNKTLKLDFTPYNIQPLLLKGILNGEFSPQLYSSCIEYNEIDKNKSTGKAIIKIDLQKQTVSILYPPKEDLDNINKNRQLACLEPFEDCVRKNKDIELLMNKYPFTEHLAISKRLGINKTTSEKVSFELMGQWVDESFTLQKKTISSTELSDFILPGSSYTYTVTLPDN